MTCKLEDDGADRWRARALMALGVAQLGRDAVAACVRVLTAAGTDGGSAVTDCAAKVAAFQEAFQALSRSATGIQVMLLPVHAEGPPPHLHPTAGDA